MLNGKPGRGNKNPLAGRGFFCNQTIVTYRKVADNSEKLEGIGGRCAPYKTLHLKRAYERRTAQNCTPKKVRLIAGHVNGHVRGVISLVKMQLSSFAIAAAGWRYSG